MPLSADPAKRRRQLESLQAGAAKRVATLQSAIDELDRHPRSSEDAPGGRIEAASVDGIEDRPGPARTTFARGGYGPSPAATTPASDEGGGASSPASAAADVDDDELEVEAGAAGDVDELEEHPLGEDPAPSTMTKIGAALLGVRPK